MTNPNNPDGERSNDQSQYVGGLWERTAQGSGTVYLGGKAVEDVTIKKGDIIQVFGNAPDQEKPNKPEYSLKVFTPTPRQNDAGSGGGSRFAHLRGGGANVDDSSPVSDAAASQQQAGGRPPPANGAGTPADKQSGDPRTMAGNPLRQDPGSNDAEVEYDQVPF